MKARLEPKRVKGKTSCRTIQEKLNDNPYDMPSRIGRAIKNLLVNVYSRKSYYEYHNGTRLMTPDVEHYDRQTIKNFGWTQEPNFAGYVEEYLW